MGRRVGALLLAVCAWAGGAARAEGTLRDCPTISACMRILDKEAKASHGDVLVRNPAAAAHLKHFGDPAKRALLAWGASDDSDRIAIACTILPGWLRPVKSDIAMLVKVMPSYHCGDNLSPKLGQVGTPEAIRALVERLRWWGDGDGTGAILQKMGSKATPYLLAALGDGKVWNNLVKVVLASQPALAADVPRWTAVATDRAQHKHARIAALRLVEAADAKPAATADAIRPLLRDPDPAVADAAREALRSMSDPSVLEPVAQACQGSIVKGVMQPYTSLSFRNECIEEIAAYGMAAWPAAPLLTGRFLGSPNGQDRAYGAAFIGAIGYEPAVPRLIALLNDRDWRVVYAAARSLGWLRAPMAAPALTAVARSHWLPEVRMEASAALTALKPDGAPLGGAKHIKTGDTYMFPGLSLAVDATNVPDIAPCAGERWQFRGLEFGSDGGEGREVRYEPGSGQPAGRIVGANHGEFGGGLFWQEAGRKPVMLFPTNAIALAPTSDGVVAAFGEVGAFKQYDPHPPNLPEGLEDITISNGPSGYGFVLSATRDAAGSWQLAEIARLPRSPDTMKAVAPGLYAAWSGNRVVVFSKAGIEGLASCKPET